MMLVLTYGLAGLLALCAALWILVHYRIRFLEREFPSLDADTRVSDPVGGWPLISLLVPARNEERDVAACLASLASQDYPSFELIFVDDESTDRTLALAHSALDGKPHCRVIAGKPRPDTRWVGKSWALVQGLDHARGDWLLFIDSDVVHHPSAVRKAMAMATEQGADAFSIMPAIECRSFWEKIIMPLFALLSGLVAPLDRANRPEKRGSRLSGAFILVRRAAYESCGGHAAMREQILEDMALARRLKGKGHLLWLTYTHDLTRTRMYDNFRDLWAGLGRLSFPMLNYSLARLLLAYLAAIVGTLAPWIGILAGALWLGQGDRVHGGLFLGTGVVLQLYILHVLKKVFEILRQPRIYGWFLALASSIYCLAATASALRHVTGRGLGWKQRTYHTGPS